MESNSKQNSDFLFQQATIQSLPDYLIINTRSFVKQFDELQRLNMASHHLQNALRCKQPRFDIINSLEPHFYKKIYHIQTSWIWEILMILISFIHTYIIIFENTTLNTFFRVGSPIFYSFFLLDFVMQTYHESYDQVYKKARFARLFIIKIIFLVLLGMDQIFIGIDLNVNGRAIHPFMAFRVAMPILNNRQIRRIFQALASAWKDIILLFIFYGIVVVFFSILFKELISVPTTKVLDEYQSNYFQFDKMIFITYILGTYDSYPDNQLPAIEQNTWYYGMFILYIFLNMFIFTSIPGSLIFDRFRQTRGKKQLLDETKMQTSLIVAFITLGEENYQLDIQKLIKFLLHYYERRVRFVDPITELLLKLNTNDHPSIHINEFMQLGRILQQNSNLRPPIMSDWPAWINFRQYVNERFKLKNIVSSTCYKLINAIMIIVSVVMAVLYLFTNIYAYEVIDLLCINVFMVELIITLVAIGPENHFNKMFSVVDCVLVVSGFIFQFFQISTNADALIRIVRIFNSSFLLQTLLSNSKWKIQWSVYESFKNLILRMTVIVPIILKFLPLFMIIYYVLGVLSMEIFYDAAREAASDKYGIYDQFSNFSSFLQTQLVMFQLLTEAGWSMIAFDISSRMPDKYGLVMVIFCSFHIIITLILATLIKGMVWSAFLAVSKQYDINKQEKCAEDETIEKNSEKHHQIDDLQRLIIKLESMKLDTVVKREVYEMKMNQELLDKLHRINRKKKLGRRSAKEVSINAFYRNFGVNQMILEEEQENKQYKKTQQYLLQILQKFTRQKFHLDADILYDEHEYELKMKKICQEMKAKILEDKYLNIKKHDLLNKHISHKLERPCRDIGQHNTVTHIFDMYILLGSHPTWKEQKKLVLKCLLDKGHIAKEEFQELLHKKLGKKQFKLDENCIIRKTYMQGTNPKLIEKFEAEYFENIYGRAFKEINKVTIEPLIKLEAKVIYGLKNICRYPQMGYDQFFKILAQLQNIISNQLLKSGSLFKMVFQLNSHENLWFSFYLDANEVPHLTFLKNGIWIFNDELQEHEIYHIKDLFKFQSQFKGGNILERGQLVKELYSTFQTLALGLKDKQMFFESNPQYHVYDTYFMHINIESIRRLIQKNLEISKIMVVLLTKQNERTNQTEIPFQVSQIPIQKFSPQVQFKLDETEGETFKKLNNLASLKDEEISAREGLPFSYVLNFLQEVDDILKLYCPNLIHYVEDLLNTQLKQTVE